jgi:hypothetical protein
MDFSITQIPYLFSSFTLLMIAEVNTFRRSDGETTATRLLSSRAYFRFA